MNLDFEEYVLELLAAIQPGLTRDEFIEKCRQDIAAGYRDEVEEAWIYYSEPKNDEP